MWSSCWILTMGRAAGRISTSGISCWTKRCRASSCCSLILSSVFCWKCSQRNTNTQFTVPCLRTGSCFALFFRNFRTSSSRIPHICSIRLPLFRLFSCTRYRATSYSWLQTLLRRYRCICWRLWLRLRRTLNGTSLFCTTRRSSFLEYYC